MKKPNNGARKRTQSRQNSPKNRPKNAVKNVGKNPQKNTKKTSPKSTQKDTATPCGCCSWLVYSDLPTKSPKFTPPKIHKNATFTGENWQEIQSNFNDYLEYENLTIAGLQGDKLALYLLHDYMKSKAPSRHRVGGCLEHRIRETIGQGKAVKQRGVFIVLDKETGRVGVGNTARCKDPFCPFCNEHDGEKQAEKARVVQETHIANGGECLQATFTAPNRKNSNLKTKIQKMQKAYEHFTRATAKALKIEGLAGKLKRNEYAYGLMNGHNFHIHVAYAVGKITDEQLKELAEIMRLAWLKALEVAGLVVKGKKAGQEIRAFDLRKNKNAFSYVAKKSKSKFTKEDLELIKKKAQTRNLSIFELAELARNGEFCGDKFATIYAELLNAWHGLTTLKYSKGLLDDLGLMVYEQESPKTGDIATQSDTATDTPSEPQKPKNPQKTPKKRYIYDTKRELITLFELNWFLWLELKRNNEHLIFLGMIQNAVDKGYYSIE